VQLVAPEKPHPGVRIQATVHRAQPVSKDEIAELVLSLLLLEEGRNVEWGTEVGFPAAIEIADIHRLERQPGEDRRVDRQLATDREAVVLAFLLVRAQEVTAA